MFETRFFSVQLDGKGRLLSTDTGKIAALDSEAVKDYAHQAMSGSAASGFVSDYRYLRYEDGDTVRVLFPDCGRMLAGFRSVLPSSMCVSVAGLAAVLVLMILLSDRIVKPVLLSCDKQKQFITDAGHEIKTPSPSPSSTPMQSC